MKELTKFGLIVLIMALFSSTVACSTSKSKTSDSNTNSTMGTPPKKPDGIVQTDLVAVIHQMAHHQECQVKNLHHHLQQ